MLHSAAVGSAQPHASLVDLTFVKARTPSHSTRRYTEPPLDFEHRTPFAALRRVLRTRTNPASYSIYYSSTYGTYVALYVCRYVLRTSAPYVVCMYYYCASSCPVNFKIILAQAMHWMFWMVKKFTLFLFKNVNIYSFSFSMCVSVLGIVFVCFNLGFATLL